MMINEKLPVNALDLTGDKVKVNRPEPEQIPPAMASEKGSPVKMDRRPDRDKQENKNRHDHKKANANSTEEENQNSLTYTAEGHLQEIDERRVPHSIDLTA